MSRSLRQIQARASFLGAAAVAAVVGVAVASLVAEAVAGGFTLQVARNATVTNQKASSTTESIVVSSRGRAVYDLTGDSARHPECTKANGCFSFWPPVTVASPRKLTKAPGVIGKLGTWHRGGLFQVTLGGHPLYRFASDSEAAHATGEGLQSFHGTWHVLKAARSSGSLTTTTGKTSTTTSTTTSAMTSPTTPTTCAYPPYC